MSDMDLQQIKDIVEQMTPQERAELVEWVDSEIKPSLEQHHSILDEIDLSPDPQPGAVIAAMLRQMDPVELVDPEITDPVEWVEAQRRKRRIQLEDDNV